MNTTRKYLLSERCPAGMTFLTSERHLDRYDNTYFHTHDYAEITWIAAGKAIHHGNPYTQVEAPAGFLILVRPEHIHALRPDTDDTIFRNVEFPESALRDLAVRYNSHIEDFWAGTRQPAAMNLSPAKLEALNNLFDDTTRRPSSRFFLDMFLMNALLILERIPEPETMAVIPLWLQSAITNLRNPLRFHLGLEGFFNDCHCTRNHATRCCKKYYGCPPGEIFKRARISMAASLLTNTEDDIINIALKAGYNDTAHFYRDFKSIYKTTPKKYRR